MVARASASAPGKIILFGEHFVVRGARSLVSAVSLRVRVSLSETRGGAIRVRSPAVGLDARISTESLEPSDERLAPIARLIAFLRDEYGFSVLPHEAVVESEIPVGAGLGSSASLAAAYALAYTALHGAPLGRDDLVRASYEAEKVAHGRPSGVDNTVAVVGGTLLYRRGEGFRRVDVRLPEGSALLVVDSGVSRSTRRAVEDVLARAEATWRAAEHIYRAADEIVDLALEAFRRGDARLLGELMDLNQGLLNAMGASSEVIESIVFEARRAGAYGAKLTGAGRGGAVIVLAPEEASWELAARLSRKARGVYRVGLGVQGARLEE